MKRFIAIAVWAFALAAGVMRRLRRNPESLEHSRDRRLFANARIFETQALPQKANMRAL